MHALSIIIPSYNAGTWLPKTIGKLKIALERAEINDYEIIVVDDGSTDDTKTILSELRRENARIIPIHQSNKGRFLARKAGVKKATKEYVLFIDSRVYADEGSLLYVSREMKKNPDLVAWNGHVRIKLGWNVFARFWDAVTFIAWRKYLRKPRLLQYGIEDFDYYPKGTTFFLAPKAILEKYIDAFTSNIKDLRFVSDDTALLRNVAQDLKIAIAPQFSCLYHSRDRMSAFVKHTMNRGTFFVDGFFRPGNRFFAPLVCFLIASPIALVAMVVWPFQILTILASVWLLELLLALVLGVPVASALSLWILSPLFFVIYGAGIWRGVIIIFRQKIMRQAS